MCEVADIIAIIKATIDSPGPAGVEEDDVAYGFQEAAVDEASETIPQAFSLGFNEHQFCEYAQIDDRIELQQLRQVQV